MHTELLCNQPIALVIDVLYYCKSNALPIALQMRLHSASTQLSTNAVWIKKRQYSAGVHTELILG